MKLNETAVTAEEKMLAERIQVIAKHMFFTGAIAIFTMFQTLDINKASDGDRNRKMVELIIEVEEYLKELRGEVEKYET